MVKHNRITLSSHNADNMTDSYNTFQRTRTYEGEEKLTSIPVIDNVEGFTEMEVLELQEFCARALVEAYDKLDVLVNESDTVYRDVQEMIFNLQGEIFQFQQFYYKVMEAFFKVKP